MRFESGCPEFDCRPGKKNVFIYLLHDIFDTEKFLVGAMSVKSFCFHANTKYLILREFLFIVYLFNILFFNSHQRTLFS